MESNKKRLDTLEKQAEQKQDRPDPKTRLEKAVDSLSRIATVQGGGKK